jgi:hypothetical protein
MARQLPRREFNGEGIDAPLLGDFGKTARPKAKLPPRQFVSRLESPPTLHVEKELVKFSLILLGKIYEIVVPGTQSVRSVRSSWCMHFTVYRKAV